MLWAYDRNILSEKTALTTICILLEIFKHEFGTTENDMAHKPHTKVHEEI